MKPPKVVAEIGQAEGDPLYVQTAIEEAAAAGCWGVKVQLLRPERIAQAGAATYWRENRPDIPDQRANFARTGCLAYDPSALGDLVSQGLERGVELYASPFDHDAVETMAKAGMRWCKIASGDLTNAPLLRHAAETFPGAVILATGAATLAEIHRAVDEVVDASGDDPAYLLACSLAYPTPDEHAELARITALAHRFAIPVGYSDHTYMAGAAAVATALGARMLEKHVTLNPSNPNVPDNAFALTTQLLKLYVANARQAAAMVGRGRLEPTEVELAARAGARRSVCAARDLVAGQVVGPGDLEMLRPWVDDGFPAERQWEVIGRRLTDAVAAGRPIPRRAVAP